MLIRRVRRVIGERARAVHPDLQPATYLLLAHVAEVGPVRASALVERLRHRQGRGQPAGRSTSSTSACSTRTQDPDDGRATLLAVSDEGRTRLDRVASRRAASGSATCSGSWSDDELADFAGRLARYNATLD